MPLTPNHGVVEWVNNTLSLSEYLLLPPETSAHVRYRHDTQKYDHSSIHKRIKQAKERDLSKKEHGIESKSSEVHQHTYLSMLTCDKRLLVANVSTDVFVACFGLGWLVSGTAIGRLPRSDLGFQACVQTFLP